MPPVQVVTINAGRGHHLHRLLEGLARGHQAADCIVVQMGGDRGVSSELPDGEVAPIRQVHLDRPGLPLAAARNAGRRAARGDILVFLDVDCIPSADLVTVLSRHAAGHEALVCCEVTYLPVDAVGDDWTEDGLRRMGRRHPARVFPYEGLVRAAHPGLFWSLAFAVRTSVFDRIGGFDEAFDGYGAEDTDFAVRADAMGIPVLFSADGHAFHQHHAAYDPPLQHFADIMRNARLFRSRHHAWPMQGWLDDFVRWGLISATPDGDYIIRRHPTHDDLAAAKVPGHRPF